MSGALHTVVIKKNFYGPIGVTIITNSRENCTPCLLAIILYYFYLTCFLQHNERDLMNTRIIINGKEVSNPFIRILLILGAIIIAALVAAVVIFILLPVIGIAVTLSLGFIVIFIVAIMASVVSLVLITIISSWLFGSTEFRIVRIHRK